MNPLRLGSLVQIMRHHDEAIVGKFGRVTSIVQNTVSINIDENTPLCRQVPIVDVEVIDENA